MADRRSSRIPKSFSFLTNTVPRRNGAIQEQAPERLRGESAEGAAETWGDDGRASSEFPVASVAAVASIIIAVLGLMGYVPGLSVLGRMRQDYIPMTPSTAISFLLLNGILLGLTRRYWHPLWAAIAGGLALSVSVFGLLEVIGSGVGRDLNFEDILVPSAGNLGSVPIARMSPSTGAVFAYAGFAVWLLVCRAPDRGRWGQPVHWSGGLGAVWSCLPA